MIFLKKGIFVLKGMLEKILAVGIFVRFVLFVFLSPFNNDGHFQVIQYLFVNHKLPVSGELNQAFHPPLYHIMASILMMFGNEYVIHFFSFLLSVATLYIFYWLIKNTALISSINSKQICLALASLHPSFVMFSSYISNDVLSFFIGALIFLQMYFVLLQPNLLNHSVLALYVGLGLLTKGTLLFFIPPLMFFLIMINLRHNVSFKKIVGRFLVCSVLIGMIGSYKYVENIRNYGCPFVHNLDFKHIWADMQRPTYVGVSSFFDINIIKLLRQPTVSDETKHSYPLMMYATFWYQFIPESNFMGNLTKFKYLGSIIYLFALLPTILLIIGFFRILAMGRRLFRYKTLSQDLFDSMIYRLSLLLIFLTTFIMIIYIGMKYDVWSCFQSRLFYAAYFAILLFLNSGIEYVTKKSSSIWKYFRVSFVALYICFATYLGSEIVGQVAYNYRIIPKVFLFDKE
jgi:hypothetical protein